MASTCTQYEYGIDILRAWLAGGNGVGPRDAFHCTFQAGFGGPSALLAFVILAGVGLSLYIVGDDIILPWAAMTATAGVTMPWLTSVGVTIMVVVILVVGGGAFVIAVRKGTPRV